MALDASVAWHISTSDMDAHTWVVFAIALGPALLMMVVVALRVRQDARADAAGLADRPPGTPGRPPD
jgi:hypothetical protein